MVNTPILARSCSTSRSEWASVPSRLVSNTDAICSRRCFFHAVTCVGVELVLAGDLGDGLVTAEGREGDFGFELGTVVASFTLHLMGHSGLVYAENPNYPRGPKIGGKLSGLPYRIADDCSRDHAIRNSKMGRLRSGSG